MFFATLFLSPWLLVSPASISTMAWCHENDYFACCSLIWLCTQVLRCCKRNLWVQGFILATNWLYWVFYWMVVSFHAICVVYCVIYCIHFQICAYSPIHFTIEYSAMAWLSQVLVCWTASRCFFALYFCDKPDVIIKMQLYDTCFKSEQIHGKCKWLQLNGKCKWYT